MGMYYLSAARQINKTNLRAEESRRLADSKGEAVFLHHHPFKASLIQKSYWTAKARPMPHQEFPVQLFSQGKIISHALSAQMVTGTAPSTSKGEIARGRTNS